jgi:hypothetical protein
VTSHHDGTAKTGRDWPDKSRRVEKIGTGSFGVLGAVLHKRPVVQRIPCPAVSEDFGMFDHCKKVLRYTL